MVGMSKNFCHNYHRHTNHLFWIPILESQCWHIATCKSTSVCLWSFLLRIWYFILLFGVPWAFTDNPTYCRSVRCCNLHRWEDACASNLLTSERYCINSHLTAESFKVVEIFWPLTFAPQPRLRGRIWMSLRNVPFDLGYRSICVSCEFRRYDSSSLS